MNITGGGRAKRVRFYVNESDQTAGMSTAMWLVEFLRKRNASGATLVRGGMGFGSSGRIHTWHIVDLAVDMPVIVEWVDDEERVQQLLPEITALITPGLVTVEDTVIALYAPHPMRDVSSELAAAAVMTKNPICVNLDTPAREIVERMHKNGLRGVPVVDAGIPAGMITSCDLLTRAGLAARLSHFPRMQPSEVNRHLDGLRPLVAREIMTAPVVTIPAGLPLNQAAAAMVHRRLKRLPVVDERGALIGILSRVDLLRTVAQFPDRERPERPGSFSSGHVALERVTRREVPTVFSNTPIAQVLQALISTRLNIALVVDPQRHVVGIVTSAELLQRVTPALRPSAMATLLHRLPFFHPDPQEDEEQRHARATTAAELMTNNFITATPDSQLNEVVATMIGGAHKIVAVVDNDEQLIGVVDRADVLRGLLRATI